MAYAFPKHFLLLQIYAQDRYILCVLNNRNNSCNHKCSIIKWFIRETIFISIVPKHKVPGCIPHLFLRIAAGKVGEPPATIISFHLLMIQFFASSITVLNPESVFCLRCSTCNIADMAVINMQANNINSFKTFAFVKRSNAFLVDACSVHANVQVNICINWKLLAAENIAAMFFRRLASSIKQEKCVVGYF